MAHELDHPGSLLQTHDATLACSTLTGVQNTEARERSSIFSAAADALDAYTAHGALAAATNPNFNADQFVRSHETIYIHAPAEHQAPGRAPGVRAAGRDPPRHLQSPLTRPPSHKRPVRAR